MPNEISKDELSYNEKVELFKELIFGKAANDDFEPKKRVSHKEKPVSQHARVGSGTLAGQSPALFRRGRTHDFPQRQPPRRPPAPLRRPPCRRLPARALGCGELQEKIRFYMTLNRRTPIRKNRLMCAGLFFPIKKCLKILAFQFSALHLQYHSTLLH